MMKKLNINDVLKNFDNNGMTAIVTDYLNEEEFGTVTEIIEYLKINFDDVHIADMALDVDLFEDFNDLPWLCENSKTFDDYVKERGYATQVTIFENITFAKQYENELTLKKIVKDLLEYLENNHPLFESGTFNMNIWKYEYEVQYIKEFDKIIYLLIDKDNNSDYIAQISFVWDDDSIKTEQDLKHYIIEMVRHEMLKKRNTNDC